MAIAITLFTLPNAAAPGIYYDEALCAGWAKDFLTADPTPHIQAPVVVSPFGHPLPILLQSYLGGLKTYMLIPSFAIFGSSMSVLRTTDVCWSLLALLVFMLWARKLFGLPVALVAGVVLALDPSYIFLSVLDWGPFVPTFLCRVCGWFFFLLWTQNRKWRDALLAGLFFGLGVFNKVDFVVILFGCGLALLLTWRKAVFAVVRESKRQIAAGATIFLVATSPLIFCLSDVLGLAIGTSTHEGDFAEKLNTTEAMYDGSYIHRLMDVGGRFDLMYRQPDAVWSPFGLIVIAAAVLLAIRTARTKGEMREQRLATFALLALILLSVGALMLPGAVRMHHTTLVYPFPHLAVALAAVLLWQTPSANIWAKRGLRGLAVLLVGAALVGHVNSLLRTQQLIQATGGRGQWSNALETFCNDVKDEKQLSIVSLDWGFNEQLCFLTEDKDLNEPFWTGRERFVKKGIYLAHPAQYAIVPEAPDMIEFARNHPELGFSVKPYNDRQGNVAFYAIRYEPVRRQ